MREVRPMSKTKYTYGQRWRMALEPPVYAAGKRVVPDDVRCPDCGRRAAFKQPPWPWRYACDACWTQWDERTT